MIKNNKKYKSHYDVNSRRQGPKFEYLRTCTIQELNKINQKRKFRPIGRENFWSFAAEGRRRPPKNLVIWGNFMFRVPRMEGGGGGPEVGFWRNVRRHFLVNWPALWNRYIKIFLDVVNSWISLIFNPSRRPTGMIDVVSSCRKAGISDKTYYYWRKKFGGMGRSQLSEMRALRKENGRLKKILTELQLDKLILKESLDYLKPKAWRLMGCVRPLSTPVKS